MIVTVYFLWWIVPYVNYSLGLTEDQFSCANCNGTDCPEIPVMYTSCKTQCMMKRTLLDRLSRKFWYEMKCVEDENQCSINSQPNSDGVTWCCGFSKCNEPHRCPFCSDSPSDNVTYRCSVKPETGDGIEQTGNYDICTKSSKCISISQKDWNGRIIYKQKRCATHDGECKSNKCCDVTSCEQAININDSDTVETNPLLYFAVILIIIGLVSCLTVSVSRSGQEQRLRKRIRVDKGGECREGEVVGSGLHRYRNTADPNAATTEFRKKDRYAGMWTGRDKAGISLRSDYGADTSNRSQLADATETIPYFSRWAWDAAGSYLPSPLRYYDHYYDHYYDRYYDKPYSVYLQDDQYIDD